MRVHVSVYNAEWMEGCQDTEDHDHPPEFEAVVRLPNNIDYKDQLAMNEAIHEALIEQCDCCVVNCDIEVDRIEGFKDSDNCRR